jgi:hypothetical protein
VITKRDPEGEHEPPYLRLDGKGGCVNCGPNGLRAGISGLLAVVFAALAVTEPVASFLLASSGICLAVIGTGVAASALWFFAVVRRYGLRLRLARA